MNHVTNFRQTRRDGKVIEEQMSVEDILCLGWKPDKIVHIEWKFDGRAVNLDFPRGVLAEVLPSRYAVVFRPHSGEMLLVFNSDGTERLRVTEIESKDGKMVSGTFEWFELPRSGVATNIGVVYRRADNGHLFETEIDTSTGKAVQWYQTK